MKSFKQSASVLLVLVLLGSGCAHHPINAPLVAVDVRTGYRFENAAFSTNSDDLFLMLAFSGGGMRAAALDFGVNQLADDSDRRFFNSVPTRLQLPSATVDRLRSIAATELARNEEFQRLIGDLRNGSNPVNFPTGMKISQSTERNSQ